MAELPLQTLFDSDLQAIDSLDALETLRIKYLGRSGLINQRFQSLTQQQKAKRGRELNELKQQIQSALTNKQSEIYHQKSKISIDVTVPGIKPAVGHLHLITQAISEISDIFGSLGFVRRRYPEVDTDWYYAEGLNIPKEHPARDDQETFYFTEDVVLTAHTSNGQLREMEHTKPPIKMLNIGKTYRRQADASHAPMFHQFEGLVVDKDINITHLVGVLDYFVKSYFGKERRVRLRPHHFQFTEPSFEVDCSCGVCGGDGVVDGQKCRVCKAGWLELGGAGMVHPTVLRNGNIDPAKYTGFAFGWGVERVLWMKHKLTDDLRDIYSTNLKYLQQF